MRAAGDDRLDNVFHALANRTRRALLRSLAEGPARVTELAAPHRMSLAAVSKHLFVLERAGLIERKQKGSVQSCVLDPKAMLPADEWIANQRRFWNSQIDRLAALVEREKS